MAEDGQLISCHAKAVFDDVKQTSLAAGKLVVIDFTASWCGPCRFIAPTLADLANKYPHVVFLKVDVDELKEVSAAYKVEAMPTFVFLKHGDNKEIEVERVVGAKKETLLNAVSKHGGSIIDAAA